MLIVKDLLRAFIILAAFLALFFIVYVDSSNLASMTRTILIFLAGIFLICVAWIIPPSFVPDSLVCPKFHVSKWFIWGLFFFCSFIIARIKGINLLSISDVFEDREKFFDAQTGFGIVFIVFFELFFGYWVANYITGRINIKSFFLVILLYTFLSYSRAYLFYALVAVALNAKINIKSIIYLIIGALLSLGILAYRFNITDLGSLNSQSIVVELVQKYPFIGLARLNVSESLGAPCNRLTAALMPYDFIIWGPIEICLGINKGEFSFTRAVGMMLSEFRKLPLLEKGTLDSFNAFGTILYPFKFWGPLAPVVLTITTLFNSCLFVVLGVTRRDSIKVLAFLITAGALISLFSTLIIPGLLIGLFCPIKNRLNLYV